MKKELLSISAVLLLGFTAYGQQIQTLGIGTNVVDESAILHVNSNNKGVLFPNVRLTSYTLDIDGITGQKEGLIVYNPGTVSVPTGYYYWNGAKWILMAGSDCSGSSISAASTTAQVPCSDISIYNNNGTLLDNRIVDQSDKSLTFQGTGNTIFNSGKVGVGSVNPKTKFEVVAPPSAVNGISVRNDAAWDALGLAHDGSKAYINAAGAEQGLVMRVGTGNAGDINTQNFKDVMVLRPDGTSNALGNFTVGTGGKADLTIVPGNASQSAHMIFKNGNGNRLGYLGYDNSNLAYTTENGAKHVFKGSDVVIPNNNLVVGGQVKIEGGMPGAGKVLTSDSNGLATWKQASETITPQYIKTANGKASVTMQRADPEVLLTTTDGRFSFRYSKNNSINGFWQVRYNGAGSSNVLTTFDEIYHSNGMHYYDYGYGTLQQGVWQTVFSSNAVGEHGEWNEVRLIDFVGGATYEFKGLISAYSGNNFVGEFMSVEQL